MPPTELPQNISWDFGSMQAKIKVQSGEFTWSLFGNGGSSYPMRSVTGVQYEKGSMLAWMSHIVILVSGGDNRRIQVPKSEKSERIVKNINLYISDYHKAASASSAPPAAALSVADELAKLALLKQQGVLTEDEFQSLKAKLIVV